MAIFSLGLVATAGALLLRGDRAIDRIQVEGVQAAGDLDGDGEVEVGETKEVLQVLVVGSDAREGLTPEQKREFATGEADGLRTDTIMLVRVDPVTDQAAILSFPRDLLVERCDGTVGKINAAYGIGEETGTGGASCLLRTVSALTNIPIQHYVEVDFSGFVNVVDIVGGVSLYLDEPLEDPKSALDLPAGCVTLQGADALGFVRTRSEDSDYGRIARQQRFLRELVADLTSVDTLTNVPRLFALVDAAAGSVTADDGLSLGVMRRLAFSLRDLSADRIATRTVPAETIISNGEYVGEEPIEEEAQQLFTAFRTGALTSQPEKPAEPKKLGPADVPPALVLNGEGTPGLATEAAEALRAQGYEIARTGDAESFDIAATVVRHPPELAAVAEVLTESLPGVELEEVDTGEPLALVLGDDFDMQTMIPAPEASAGPSAATPSEPAPTPSQTPTLAPEPTPDFAGARDSDIDC